MDSKTLSGFVVTVSRDDQDPGRDIVPVERLRNPHWSITATGNCPALARPMLASYVYCFLTPHVAHSGEHECEGTCSIGVIIREDESNPGAVELLRELAKHPKGRGRKARAARAAVAAAMAGVA